MPVLIDDANSVFTAAEILAQAKNPPGRRSGSQRFRLGRHLPRLTKNLKAEGNYNKFAGILLKSSRRPKVMVIGGGEIGQGSSDLFNRTDIDFLHTDVYFSENVMLICDAHGIPLKDGSIDGVIAQAVLEHVVDPQKCVSEIHRILKQDGIVYAETPFMQQVHMAAYDFTRFTLSGHRLLFKDFEVIDEGSACGPGAALAWSFRYFLLSWSKRRIFRQAAIAISSLTAFWLVWLDKFLIDRDSAQDAASAVYFLGRRASQPVDPRSAIARYRGGF